MDSSHPSALADNLLLAQCRITRGRRGGPGGQHRNKVETAVVVEHTPTGVRGEASERRSQEQNRRAAVFRLRVNLALEMRCRPGDDQSPSALWSARCRAGRLSINPQHDDFPALLAEALDRLAAEEFDVKQAAARLRITTSQLTKLLKLEPRALEQVNAQRQGLSLRPLR